MKRITLRLAIVIFVIAVLALLNSYVRVLENQKSYDNKIDNLNRISIFYEEKLYTDSEVQKELSSAREYYAGYSNERMVDVKIENNKLTYGLLASQQRVDKTIADKKEAYKEDMRFWFSVGYLISLLKVLIFITLMYGLMIILINSENKKQKVSVKEFINAKFSMIVSFYLGMCIEDLLFIVFK